MVRRRVSFEEGGKRLDNLFKLVFVCSVWPSDAHRELVLDLVLLRNLIVHSNGQDWSQDGVHQPAYALQFRRADVLAVRRYGDLATYSVDRHKALRFLHEAVQAIVDQAKYLEGQLAQKSLGPPYAPRSSQLA